MVAPQCSPPDPLERLYGNRLTLLVENQGRTEVGENVRGALDAIGENAGHIKQGIAKLCLQHRGD
ncbi:hypothetical protein [Pseudomonas sp. P1.31]|uniref:hypothetical protein n=1 Tax=Pseudomonas sp. P1.31 TaxID=1699311 RepID=UPI00069D4790|nr:hypothetical protein [Pseudomonas sp. P1.31]